MVTKNFDFQVTNFPLKMSGCFLDIMPGLKWFSNLSKRRRILQQESPLNMPLDIANHVFEKLEPMDL